MSKKISSHTNVELKNIIKKYNLHTQIKGYSTMKKNDLINHIQKHLIYDNGLFKQKNLYSSKSTKSNFSY